MLKKGRNNAIKNIEKIELLSLSKNSVNEKFALILASILLFFNSGFLLF
jgi:hypothetical protein